MPAGPGPVLRQLPNILTILRLVLAGTFVWLMSYEGLVTSYLALATFGAASLTDLFDGILARKWKVTSRFGIFMDPLADKVLVLSALLVFVWQNLVPVWLVLVIWAREISVQSLRGLAEARGVSLPATPLGKQKMVSQIIAILGTLAVLCAEYTITRVTGYPWDTWLVRSGPRGALVASAMGLLPSVLLGVAAVFSLYSGVQFVVANRRLFARGDNRR